MGATTIGIVHDRLNSLVADQGFTRCRDHFDFDIQPDQAIDRAFRVETQRTLTQGYIGGDQGELHMVQIFLARKIRSDSHGAVRQLKADLDLIEAEMYGDSPDYDYNVLDGSVTTDVRSDPDATHAIGRLMATVDFDRDL